MDNSEQSDLPVLDGSINTDSTSGLHSTSHSSDSTTANEEFDKKRLQEEEAIATEKVLNALLSYRRFSRSCIRRRWKTGLNILQTYSSLSQEQQILLSPAFPESIKRMKYCVEENYKIIQMIISHGVTIFGDDCSMREAVKKAQTTWSVSEHYMSKVKSTLKQIVRDWSTEGSLGFAERNACYSKVTEALCSHFPDKDTRHEVNILVPGAGLGRLAWDFVQEGFSVQGNEFSLFMLLTSNFIFNRGLKANEFTIYPYVLETCNNWSYEDQLRPITFPDVPMLSDAAERPNSFSMCAGDFLQVTKNDDCEWSAVITVFFMDTAMNIIDYIDTIYRILKSSGVWINLGPLTYHFTESDGALELPYSEVINLIQRKGFRFEDDFRAEGDFKALYASNSKSMLHYEYHCGFFKCIKI